MHYENIDPITLSVIHNRQVNICREMGIAMMKTSYSTIFNEGLDFSCVIFNKDGEMIAQAEFCPAQLGAILFTIKWAIEEYGAENFEPGDVVIHNDPYRGGCHMPEHAVIKPVYYQGELFGFVANIGHVAEIGGMAPGSFAATATDVYQEGLRLPLVKIMRRGKYMEDIWKIILANHRTPDHTWGDFHAMIGSLHVAERRLEILLEQYGVTLINKVNRELMDHAERWMREEIRAIPNGEYYFEDCVEDDGVTNNPTWIRLNLVVMDDMMIADYSASDPQAKGIINCTYGVTASGTYNGVFHATDKDIPRNSGTYRPIKIIAPLGSIVNVRHPGPSVGGNTETHPRLVDIVLGALSQAIPERISAAEGGSSCNFLFGGNHPDTGKYYVVYNFEGCGWGAKHNKDGNNAVVVPNGNCRNTPVEIFESRYPWLTRSYKLVQDSGGAGKHRGGLGIRRVIEVTKTAQINISAVFERMKVRPWGLFGGGSGGHSSILVKKRGDNLFRTFSEVYGTVSSAKFINCIVEAGDQVMLQSPGGGGYGKATFRDQQIVLEDLEQGFISQQAARDEYLVATGHDGERYFIENFETAQLRACREE